MLQKIKKMNVSELEALAGEVREQMIDVVSQNGGHIAPSLGTVELTIALLKCFDLPEDKIIWDVGHQSYAYKILTDRKDRFHTLRKKKGISGFPKISESSFDFFGTGHGGTSISASLGIKEALRRQDKLSKVVAVIGDGAMTSGLSFEAMNHAGDLGNNLITVLNDNDMFISTSVGTLSRWFSKKLSGSTYSVIRNEIKDIMNKLPAFFHGRRIIDIIRKTLESSKSLLTPGILFEGFGYQYVGPVDGHDIEELTETINDIKPNSSPVLLHVHTKKGKGYPPAEENPRKFHGLGPFEKESGKSIGKKSHSFTGYLSAYLPEMFLRNDSLVAITAAMPDGTGLQVLQKKMPDRVYDVGMSEAHAVTFAAGLASAGIRPLVAVYSTFLQRSVDSVIHDVALQKLPVVFLLDRAGIVGEDGSTHHGIFDIVYMRMVPGLTVLAPRDEVEMARMIEFAVKQPGPVSIRYPRKSAQGRRKFKKLNPVKKNRGEFLIKNKGKSLVVSVGVMAEPALIAAREVERKDISVSVYDLKFIKPLPEELFAYIEENNIEKVITVEEGVIAGGAGSAIAETLHAKNMNVEVKMIGIKDVFPLHGEQNEIRHDMGLSYEKIRDAIIGN
ncbi:MAG: 1-deoxy-D-xylulose-5-phosphate synthase [bacterium]